MSWYTPMSQATQALLPTPSASRVDGRFRLRRRAGTGVSMKADNTNKGKRLAAMPYTMQHMRTIND